MAGSSDTELRSLWPVLAVGTALTVSLVVELGVAVAGLGTPPAGFWVGAVSSLLAVVGTGYGVYRASVSGISATRHRRINRWCLVGAAGFLLVNVAFMLALPTETRFQLFSWARWAVSIGTALGIAIGLFEARAIEREIAAERSRIRRDELQRERDRLDEFASVVSHDLRNPLSVATGRLDLARREHPDDEHLRAVENALERTSAIVDETLALAREGKTVDDTGDVDLAAAADDCWARVDTAGATLEIPETTTIRADPDRLSHVFENLFRNSVQHGSTGNGTESGDAAEHGDDVTVRVGTLADESGFYVEDDGPGIPADERDRVLDPGYTSADDGTGFGLSIVDRIAAAHGWTVRVAESADGGARFEFVGVERSESD